MAHPPLRVGFLGPGRIARNALAPALRYASNCELAAVASRDADRARQIAAELGVERHHGAYEALLADDTIDAVYIGLPNGLHRPWVVAAAEAGKHVLCEKSLALTHADAQVMARACQAAGVILMEAFMIRHHPQWTAIRELVASGRLGPIRQVLTWLTGALPRTDHRFDPELGGGAMFDVTCYGINVARLIYGAEPTEITARARFAEPGAQGHAIDLDSAVTLVFPGGGTAQVYGSLDARRDQGLRIIGTEGRLEVPRPFVPWFEPTTLTLDIDDRHEPIHIGGANHYLHQVEHFADCAMRGALGWPAEDGVANVAVCEAAIQAARHASGATSG